MWLLSCTVILNPLPPWGRSGEGHFKNERMKDLNVKASMEMTLQMLCHHPKSSCSYMRERNNLTDICVKEILQMWDLIWYQETDHIETRGFQDQIQWSSQWAMSYWTDMNQNFILLTTFGFDPLPPCQNTENSAEWFWKWKVGTDRRYACIAALRFKILLQVAHKSWITRGKNRTCVRNTNVNNALRSEIHNPICVFNWTNSVEKSSSWEADTRSADQEIPSFYGARRFIAVFTRAHHRSLYWATQKPSPHLYLILDPF
jgi:hypothetical protein